MSDARWLANVLADAAGQVGRGFQRGVSMAQDNKRRREDQERQDAKEERARIGAAVSAGEQRGFAVSENEKDRALRRELAAKKTTGEDAFGPIYKEALKYDPGSAQEMVRLRQEGISTEGPRPYDDFTGPMPETLAQASALDYLELLKGARTKASERKATEAKANADATRQAEIDKLSNPAWVNPTLDIAAKKADAATRARLAAEKDAIDKGQKAPPGGDPNLRALTAIEQQRNYLLAQQATSVIPREREAFQKQIDALDAKAAIVRQGVIEGGPSARLRPGPGDTIPAPAGPASTVVPPGIMVTPSTGTPTRTPVSPERARAIKGRLRSAQSPEDVVGILSELRKGGISEQVIRQLTAEVDAEP